MKIRKGHEFVIAGSLGLALFCAWVTPALAQASPAGFPNVVAALR